MTDTTDTTPNVQLRAAAAAPARARLSGARLREAALGLAVAVALFAGGRYGYDYWTTGRYLVTTDDAYVDAHSAMISPKVSGYISEVLVNDNQTVKAGQVIARIDPRDYQTALDQARANVAAAQAKIATLTQQIAQQKLTVEQARQAVASDQAALDLFATELSSAIPTSRRPATARCSRRSRRSPIFVEKQAALERDKPAISQRRKTDPVSSRRNLAEPAPRWRNSRPSSIRRSSI